MIPGPADIDKNMEVIAGATLATNGDVAKNRWRDLLLDVYNQEAILLQYHWLHFHCHASKSF